MLPYYITLMLHLSPYVQKAIIRENQSNYQNVENGVPN